MSISASIGTCSGSWSARSCRRFVMTSKCPVKRTEAECYRFVAAPAPPPQRISIPDLHGGEALKSADELLNTQRFSVRGKRQGVPDYSPGPDGQFGARTLSCFSKLFKRLPEHPRGQRSHKASAFRVVDALFPHTESFRNHNPDLRVQDLIRQTSESMGGSMKNCCMRISGAGVAET